LHPFVATEVDWCHELTLPQNQRSVVAAFYVFSLAPFAAHSSHIDFLILSFLKQLALANTMKQMQGMQTNQKMAVLQSRYNTTFVEISTVSHVACSPEGRTLPTN
jgi:hypothetical protein